MEWGNTSWLEYFNFLRQAGGNLYDDGCTQATINSPAGAAALKFYGDLYTRYGAPKDTGFDVANGMGKGEVAMVSGGNWLLSSIPATAPALKDKLAVAPLPAGSANGATFLGGRIVGVMSYSKHQQAAADFIKYLYDPAAIKTIYDSEAAGGSLFLSSRPDQLAALPAKPEVVQTLQQIYASAEGPPACAGWEDSSANVEKALQKAMFEGATPESALADAAKIMNDNLKK
jgi:ABC-type glycerol-3-phosphate transport system substrate-binding protein